VVHPPYEKAVAGYPRTPGTQKQAADGDCGSDATAQHPVVRADGGAPSAHRAQSTWPQLPQPNWEAVAVLQNHWD